MCVCVTVCVWACVTVCVCVHVCADWKDCDLLPLCDCLHPLLCCDFPLKEREEEYDLYLSEKMITAKKEFKQLLKEIRFITHNSQKMMKESDKHLKDIIEVLKVRHDIVTAAVWSPWQHRNMVNAFQMLVVLP